MSSIKISKPIHINMEVIETDSNLPSIKMSVDIKIPHSTGQFIYQANDIWFECNEWDIFTQSINYFSVESDARAILRNMSEFFAISVFVEKGMLSFSFRSEEIYAGQGKSSISFQCIIDDDILGHIKSAFLDFEKWW